MKKLILFVLLFCIITSCIGYSQTKTEDSTKQTIQESSNHNAIDSGINSASKKEPIYHNVDQQPQYDGDIKKYFALNVLYPKEARRQKIQGKVFAKFVILSSGKIDPNSIKIERSLGYGIDEEVIRAIKAMPDWKPAKQNGIAVNYYNLISVSFNLQ